MAAPSLSIVELSENERTVLLRANIAAGGDADISNSVLADIANYAAVGPVAVALSVNRVWWSMENMSVELKFEADTPVKALTLSGNGSYDFESIKGLKNPGGAGSTGSILLDTYGIAINSALGCVGSIIVEFHKVRAGEPGGALDAAATSSLFTPEVPEVSGGIIIGGNSTASGYIRFLEDTSNGTNYIDIIAPSAITANIVLTLPDGNGGVDQILKTDVNGVLSWVDNNAGGAITPATELQGASLKLYELTTNGSNYVEVKAPDLLASDVVLTLPTATGTILSSTAIGVSVQAYDADLTDIALRYVQPATDAGATFHLLEGTDNGTNKVTIKAPAVLAGDIDFVLPATDGDNLQFLQTNGSGVTSWATVTIPSTGYVAPTTTVGSQLVALEGTNNGTNKITIQTPAALAGDLTLTLPDAAPAVTGYLLSATDAGVMSWVAAPAASIPGKVLHQILINNTPGTTTYTPAAGVTAILVELVGGGGGTGGVSNTANNRCAGAGGGGYARTYITSLAANYSVTIGAAGAATGTAGGTSSFAALLSCDGGLGSAQNSNERNSGGSAAGGILSWKGCPGTIAINDTIGLVGGNGGGSPFSGGTHGEYNSSCKVEGFMGGGAGGTYTDAATARDGSVGNPGGYVIWEYK